MLVYKDESYKINGALYEVHKRLGVGLLEKVYQEALAIELKYRNIPFKGKNGLTFTIGIKNSMHNTLQTLYAMTK